MNIETPAVLCALNTSFPQVVNYCSHRGTSCATTPEDSGLQPQGAAGTESAGIAPAPSSASYVRKKRCSEPEGVPGEAEPEVPAAKSARRGLCTSLAGFSSAESQRAPAIEVDEDEFRATKTRMLVWFRRLSVDSDAMNADSQSESVSSPAKPAPEPDEDEITLLLSAFALDTSISATPFLEEVVSHPEVIWDMDGTCGDVSLWFNLPKIAASPGWLRQNLTTASAHKAVDAPLKVPLDAGIIDAVVDAAAMAALARTIENMDFGAMQIVGQFNLGFIITRRRTDEMDDLFIVDQRAADENFETLQQTTCIKFQKLFRSQLLELTASDELLALENIEVLRQSGFEIDLQTDARLSLTAQLVSKDTVFEMKGKTWRNSSTLCTSSPQASVRYSKLGRHMGTMEQPWNARPKMHHLAHILEGQERTGVTSAPDLGC
ncbi:hypothetical protein B0H17DRAFT_1136449 [Mycena rosella]|uniref:MutL C-terminal dimerisation domain-containing protein n=1 Tax=Mycena rosella TaxID=1033263 RepID=A0AAD7DAN3_MYCRO|nr:hypothetical protein B0H17DRAFT_1136449 [Mycena rosella]